MSKSFGCHQCMAREVLDAAAAILNERHPSEQLPGLLQQENPDLHQSRTVRCNALVMAWLRGFAQTTDAPCHQHALVGMNVDAISVPEIAARKRGATVVIHSRDGVIVGVSGDLADLYKERS